MIATKKCILFENSRQKRKRIEIPLSIPGLCVSPKSILGRTFSRKFVQKLGPALHPGRAVYLSLSALEVGVLPTYLLTLSSTALSALIRTKMKLIGVLLLCLTSVALARMYCSSCGVVWCLSYYTIVYFVGLNLCMQFLLPLWISLQEGVVK